MPYHIDEENSELVFEVHDGNKLTIKIKSNIFSDSLELYLIKVGDATVPTDNNVFSANRVLYEIENAVKNIEPGNSFWELKEDENGNKYISTKYDAVSEKGLTAYASSVAQVPSIFDGLPIDNDTIYWDESTEGVKILKSKGGSVSGSGTIESISVSGTGNALTSATLSSDKKSIEFTKGTTFLTQDSIPDYLVTTNTEQEISAIKNFLSGLSIGNSKKKIYEQDGVVYIDSDVAVTGGVTAYALGGREVSTIMDGVVVDGTTIVKENGVLKALAGSNFDEEAMWTVLASSDSDRQINLSHLSNALSGYATQSWVQSQGYATQSSLDSVSEKLNDFLEGSDTDTIINKWKELEAFLSGMTESDNLAEILSMKADKTELDKYVTLSTEQTITAIKHFTQGLSVGASKHRIYEQDGVVYLDGDLAVTGGITAYAQGDRTPSTILDGLIIDETTLSKEGGKLSVIGGVGGASNWDELEGKPDWIGATKPTYNWSEILAKPTTLAGFGITDAYNKTESDSLYVNVSGDTMNGTLYAPHLLAGISEEDANKYGTSNIYYHLAVGWKDKYCGASILIYRPDATKQCCVIFSTEIGDHSVISLEADSNDLTIKNLKGNININGIGTSGLTYNNNIVWHTGNDGSGSGLDADLLDGRHYSDIVNGNVYSASKLQTGRYIWGQYFDGQQNVSGNMTGVRSITANGESHFSNGTYSDPIPSIACAMKISQNFAAGSNCYFATLNGNVGIGTTSPSQKLQVNGNTLANQYITNGAHGTNYLGGGNGDNATFATHNIKIQAWWGLGIHDYQDKCRIVFDARTGKIATTGSIGIGTESPSAALHVVGDILSTGGMTCYSSDVRAKTILEELNISLKEIAESPIVRFKWNNWKIKDDGKTHIGGIAQYIQKILPETILEADGMLNLDYATTAYIYAVQTARHLIKTDTEVNKLKRRIKKLEKQLKKLGYEEVDTMVN